MSQQSNMHMDDKKNTNESNAEKNQSGSIELPIVWIDCEMTGLDPAFDELVEIAIIITNHLLEPLHRGFECIIKPSKHALDNMSSTVENLHKKSGLLPLLHSGISISEAEEQAYNYIKTYIEEPHKANLAGSSVYVDRLFLAKFMPKIHNHLHYRLIDVSSIKELIRRWHSKIYKNLPQKNNSHRALGDIQESIEELKYYQNIFFDHPKK